MRVETMNSSECCIFSTAPEECTLILVFFKVLFRWGRRLYTVRKRTFRGKWRLCERHWIFGDPKPCWLEGYKLFNPFAKFLQCFIQCVDVLISVLLRAVEFISSIFSLSMLQRCCRDILLTGWVHAKRSVRSAASCIRILHFHISIHARI